MAGMSSSGNGAPNGFFIFLTVASQYPRGDAGGCVDTYCAAWHIRQLRWTSWYPGSSLGTIRRRLRRHLHFLAPGGAGASVSARARATTRAALMTPPPSSSRRRCACSRRGSTAPPAAGSGRCGSRRAPAARACPCRGVKPKVPFAERVAAEVRAELGRPPGLAAVGENATSAMPWPPSKAMPRTTRLLAGRAAGAPSARRRDERAHVEAADRARSAAGAVPGSTQAQGLSGMR